MTRDEWVTLIKFQLDSLSRVNGHHAFEKLCMAFAKRRIASNLLPATGPVSAGGDQGRDFETFRSYILPAGNGPDYDRRVVSDVICFACTTEAAARLKRKIRSDVKKIMHPKPDYAGPIPNRIFVMASADIAVALRHQLQAWALNTFNVSLEVIDGTALALGLASDDMVDSVVTHLTVPRDLAPSRSVLSLLQEAEEQLSNVHQQYGITLNTFRGTTNISLDRPPTSPEAAEFTVTLEFPETPEGEAAKRAFDEHERTGAPVVVPIQYVADIEMPGSLLSVLGLQKSSLGGIALPARGAGQAFACDVIAESDNGATERITGLDLRVEQAGVEQVTLSNKHLPRSPHFTLTIHRVRQSFSLAMEFQPGINVKQQLEAARFQSLVSKGAIVKFIQVENGVPLVGGVVSPGVWESPSELFIQVLEKLLEIQKGTGVLFSAPATCTVQEARDVLKVAAIVRSGETQIVNVVLKMGIDGVRMTLKAMDEDKERSGAFFASGPDASSVELFGHTIDLGRSVILVNRPYITPEDRKQLDAAIRDNDTSQSHEIVLWAPPEQQGAVKFEKWVSDRDRTLYFQENG